MLPRGCDECEAIIGPPARSVAARHAVAPVRGTSKMSQSVPPAVLGWGRWCGCKVLRNEGRKPLSFTAAQKDAKHLTPPGGRGRRLRRWCELADMRQRFLMLATCAFHTISRSKLRF